MMKARMLCVLALMLGTTACVSQPTMEPVEHPPDRPGRGSNHTLAHKILLYAPNRLLDGLDVLRAGVDLGPGLGFNAQATENLQGEAMLRSSLGVGWQTLFHSPFKSSSEKTADWIDVESREIDGKPWHRAPSDFRVEAHALLAGAHVAFEWAEFWDFLGGIVLLDPNNDDY